MKNKYFTLIIALFYIGINNTGAQDINYASRIDPSSYSINQSLEVGKTPGKLNITGAANYTVPIEIPPGTRNLQPAITLNYSSNFNDGLLGIGWNIGGLSAITRINQTIYYDGEANPVEGTLNDKYALDGKRLICTSGTYGYNNSVYGTELEDFSKIVAHGSTGEGPQYFEVFLKSGLIYEYGNTSDSKLLREGDCVLSWRLNKIKDRYNNYITFTYLTTDDEKPISLIKYTGNSSLSKNPFAEIQFQYKNRDDESTYCYGGKEFDRDILLDKILVKNNGSTYKSYNMEYIKDSYSQLQKITEGGTNGSLLNPTLFSWSEQTVSYSSGNITTRNISKNRFFHGDYNGDGMQDFVAVPGKEEYNYYDTWKLYTSDGSELDYRTSGNLENHFQKFLVSDFNGDGLTDLILIAFAGTYDFYFLESTGNGFTKHNYWYVSSSYPYHKVIDYNGDGIMEILVYKDNGDYKIMSYSGSQIISDNIPDFGDYLGYKTGNEHAPTNDFNGDGCSDILTLTSSGYKLYEFKGTGDKLIETDSGTELKDYHLLLPGDYNGDGQTDIAKASGVTNPTFSYVYYTKDGFEEISATGISGFNLEQENNRWDSYDMNADGRTDIIIWGKGQNTSNDADRINIAYNKGNGYEFSVQEYTSPIDFMIGNYSSYPPVSWEQHQHTNFGYFGDYTGDGSYEFFYNDSITHECFYFVNGTPSHLVNIITNGFGAQTEITYKPMSDASVYTKGSGASYPLCNFSSSMQLVSQTDSDDGIGGTATMTYEYEGAKIHFKGKGFIGFTETTQTNLETGISMISTNSFHTSRYFPKLTSIVTKYGSTNLSTVSNTSWGEKSLSYNRIYPYVATNVKTDNLKNLSVTTTASYNSYGSPTSIEIDYGNNHTKTTSYLYNDEKVSSWLIGRPTTITETWEKGAETNTYVTSRSYFSSNNSPDIDLYNSGNQAYWKLDRAYDSYGNLTQEKKSTTGLSDQTTTYTYSTSNGRYLEKITDPAGSEVSYTYYSNSGLLYTKTDQFGNTTVYSYSPFGKSLVIAPDVGTLMFNSRSFNVSGGPTQARFYEQSNGNDASLKKIWYDKLGRELRTETKKLDGSMVKVDKKYNNKGQLYQISEPSTGTPYKWNTTSYDSYGRVSSVNPYYGATSTFTYTNATTTKSKNSKTYKITEDAAGLVTEREDPGGIITYNYFPNGTLKSTVSPGSVTSNMTYDRNGNRLSIIDPSAGTISNTYYGTGQIKTEVSERNSTTYTYQSNGLLDKYVGSEGETNYSYNSNNQISSITSPGGATRIYAYDSNGRVSSITESVGTVSNVITYSYDTYGRLTRKYFNGTSDYEDYRYINGYLWQVKFNGSTVWQANTMDEYGRITAATNGSTSCTWEYDSGNNMLKKINAAGVMRYDYSFNGSTGNLNSRTNYLKSKTESFGYDGTLERLNSVTGPQNLTVNYTSNDNGNISYKSDAGTFQYNTSGNPFAISDIISPVNISTEDQDISYTAFEKVSQISEENKDAYFTYNADQQRIKMRIYTNNAPDITKYYFGGNCEREVDELGGSTTEYIWIGGDAYTAIALAKRVDGGSWTVYSLFRDHLGTITHTKTGSTINEYSFDAWGRRRDKDTWGYTLSGEPALIADRGFTGHEHLNDFKLINMNGRLYDLVVGRFLSPDPHIQDPGNSQNYNRYSYCLNNPLKYNDPTGEKWRWGNPFYHIGKALDNVMQWVNDNTTGLRNKMVNAGIPSFGVGVNSAHGVYHYVGNSGNIYHNQLSSNSNQVVNGAINDARAEYFSYHNGLFFGEVNMPTQAFVGQSPLANGIINTKHGNDPYQNSHGERIFSMKEFIESNRGLTRNQIISQRDNGSYSNSQAGGPYMRYVRNPHDGKVLDMRHMLIVGKYPAFVGNLFECYQFIHHEKSAFDRQDFYSNAVGYQFYSQHYSSIGNILAPKMFVNHLELFFSNPRVIYNY